jgi:hypothetical protein
MAELTRGEEAQAAVAAEAKRAKRKHRKAAVDPIAALRQATAAVVEHRRGVEKVIAYHQGKIDEARRLLGDVPPEMPQSSLPDPGSNTAIKRIVKLPVYFSMEQAKKAGLLPINVAQLCRRGVIYKVSDGQYRKVGR